MKSSKSYIKASIKKNKSVQIPSRPKKLKSSFRQNFPTNKNRNQFMISLNSKLINSQSKVNKIDFEIQI